MVALTLMPPWDVYYVEAGVEKHDRIEWAPLFWPPSVCQSDAEARVHLSVLLAEWAAVVILAAALHPVFRRSDAVEG